MIESTRMRILFLTVLSLFFSLFRGKATNIPHSCTRVGVIYLTGNVGDMIFCTPIFRALKEAKPDSQMYIVGRKRNAETLRYNPDVHAYIECPNSVYRLWKIILNLHLDYAYVINFSVLELSLLYLGGTKAIATFTAPIESAETKTYRMLKKLCIQVPFAQGSNFAIENLKLLSPFGIFSGDTRKHLFYSQEARNTIVQFLKDSGVNPEKDFIIALAPGAGTKIKQWPADRFAQVADFIYKKYKTPLFIVGGPGDVAEFNLMGSSISSDTKIISCLHHSIDELKAFMNIIDVVIANDSAPIYVGEAFGKATITIVGPTDENEHPPKGLHHRVVKSKERGVPALAAKIALDQKDGIEDAREQIEKVTVQEVLEAFESLMAALSK